MADRTHFYSIHKPCDKICQQYDPEKDELYHCDMFEITDELPIGDHDPITEVNGICKLKEVKHHAKTIKL